MNENGILSLSEVLNLEILKEYGASSSFAIPLYGMGMVSVADIIYIAAEQAPKDRQSRPLIYTDRKPMGGV